MIGLPGLTIPDMGKYETVFEMNNCIYCTNCYLISFAYL